jgi:hypothetical protein
MAEYEVEFTLKILVVIWPVNVSYRIVSYLLNETEQQMIYMIVNVFAVNHCKIVETTASDLFFRLSRY